MLKGMRALVVALCLAVVCTLGGEAFAIDSEPVMGKSGCLVADEASQRPRFLDDWARRYSTNVASDDGTTKVSWDAVGGIDELNRLVQTTDEITCFRRWSEDDAIVDAVIPLAGGSDVVTRIPATLLLENVVDNTNVCRVVTYLNRKEGFDANGRYDLLLVVLQVSNYAFVDTANWISTLVGYLRKSLAGEADIAKTEALLDNIELTLSKRNFGNGSRLVDLDPTRFQDCLARLGPDFTF